MSALSSNWETARLWGTAPVLSAPAAAGDETLYVSGLGTGTLPLGAVFFLAGTYYELAAVATITSGTATFAISPPLAVSALAAAALTDFNALATDADLTQQDSAQPGLAQRIVDPASGKSSYDGKRALVKRDIGTWLGRRGMFPSGVTYPWQFNRAATLLELAYIYQDMSRRNEGIANEKAQLYQRMYEDEVEAMQFDYSAPAVVPEATRVRTSAILWRA